MFCAPLLSTHRRRQQVVQQAVCHSERVYETSTNTNTREAISRSSSSGSNASAKSQGKGKVYFSFETTISSSFPSSSTLDCRLDLFSLRCDGRSPLLPINLFVGFHRKGAKSLHAIASSFFARSFARSLAKSRVRRAKVTHCRKFIGPTILTMTWPTDRPEYAPSAQTYTQNCGLECGQHPE